MLQARPRASLPLQILIYFDQLYCIFYFIIAFILYIYKGYTLTYPRNAIGSEIVGVFFFALYQYIRLFVGSIGNKTEAAPTMLWFVLLTLPSIVAGIFYIRLQTYVLVADVITNAIILSFIGLEFVLGIVTLIGFKTAEKNR